MPSQQAPCQVNVLMPSKQAPCQVNESGILEQTTSITTLLVTHIVFRLQNRQWHALEKGKKLLKKIWQ